jgi:hypothetical protein
MVAHRPHLGALSFYQEVHELVLDKLLACYEEVFFDSGTLFHEQGECSCFHNRVHKQGLVPSGNQNSSGFLAWGHI